MQFGLSTLTVFGTQSLVPTFDPSWYKSLKKPEYVRALYTLVVSLSYSCNYKLTENMTCVRADGLLLTRPFLWFGSH